MKANLPQELLDELLLVTGPPKAEAEQDEGEEADEEAEKPIEPKPKKRRKSSKMDEPK